MPRELVFLARGAAPYTLTWGGTGLPAARAFSSNRAFWALSGSSFRRASSSGIADSPVSNRSPFASARRALAQIEWDDTQVFERNRPILIMLATALGLSSEQLDNLFITASGL